MTIDRPAPTPPPFVEASLDPVFVRERRRLLDNCAVYFRCGCDCRTNKYWLPSRKANQRKLAAFRAAWQVSAQEARHAG